MTTESEPTPTPEPIVLQLPLPLPEEFAVFGLLEEVQFPGDLIQHWRENPEKVDMIKSAIAARMHHACRSLTASLINVIEMRAGTDAPLEHEQYLARQQELLEVYRLMSEKVEQMEKIEQEVDSADPKVD